MKKYFDLSSITLNEQGRVEGDNLSEIRDLAEHEIKSVSGGNNWTFACDGTSPQNNGCTNYYNCEQEKNDTCNNQQRCADGTNAEDCLNGFCDDTTNGGTNCTNVAPSCAA